MTEHTTGPWEALRHVLNPEDEVSPWRIVVRNADKPLAWLFGATSSHDKEAMANARLMASAPDLLEALEAACRMDIDWAEKALAAIAKAKGEAVQA